LARLEIETIDQKETRLLDEDDDEQPEVQADLAPRQAFFDDPMDDDDEDDEVANFVERLEFEREDQAEILVHDERDDFATPIAKEESPTTAEASFFDQATDEEEEEEPSFLARLEIETIDQKETRLLDEDDDEQPEVQADLAPRQAFFDDPMDDDDEDDEVANFVERLEFEREDQAEILVHDE
ncbi:MAG: hypothetical protein GY822_01240, partial [Deltaproteobacteria bacterium]|nr:hypothetical protein [Deltaproteobacteria bacterium]